MGVGQEEKLRFDVFYEVSDAVDATVEKQCEKELRGHSFLQDFRW